MRPIVLTIAFLGIALFAGIAGIAEAQSTFGTITGRITDESGAVMPGVTVEVTHLAQNVTRTEVTDERGNYSIGNLNAGVYVWQRPGECGFHGPPGDHGRSEVSVLEKRWV